jgi:hypothetical protein
MMSESKGHDVRVMVLESNGYGVTEPVHDSSLEHQQGKRLKSCPKSNPRESNL